MDWGSWLVEFLKNYGSAIAWFVAAGGWIVSGHQATNRERRKEVRTEVEEIAEVLSGLIEEVRDYYTSEPTSDQAHDAALEIKAIAKDVDQRFARLEQRRWNYEALQHRKAAKKYWESFYDSVTGDFFETSTPIGTSEEIRTFVLRSRSTALLLCDALRKAVFAQFR